MDERDKEINELRRYINVLVRENADLKARLKACEKTENTAIDARNNKG